ncbi:LysR family transcriptional regulator [Mesorhizobium opportunistum]|uniref:LysR family transcriptional regulator n=1 Tax=Mesorhizobium opportunistum TaxID=593909 RepID=A0ABV1YR86_9HYPH|nr:MULTISPECIES: LysR family transcriptional regulator [Mesorhizobium]WJI38880.1 LysR family transcriptional regulator [Mesorhizobium opportunistum]
MSRPSLNDLTAFVAVATHRSFRRAADEIGMAPSSLSHAIRALEDRVGVRLLHRTTRSVSPTEADFQLLGRLQPALASLDDALDSIARFRGNVAGMLRINAPRVVAGLLVRWVLPQMAQRHPSVTVDIVVEGRN